MLQIKGTVVRAYVAEGLTGQNGRFNGRNVIHVRPDDLETLRNVDGAHQAADGIRVACPGELPEIGAAVDFEADETASVLIFKETSAKKSKSTAAPST